MKARVWMHGGHIIIQTETTQWHIAATMKDLMAIRNGRVANVELTSVPRTSAVPSSDEGWWASLRRKLPWGTTS